MPVIAHAYIANGENALDGLGQYDDNEEDPSMIFTKGVMNDGPNKLGYAGPADAYLDTVDHWFFQADEANNRVLVYALNSDNTFPDRIPDYVLGQANFYTNAAANSQAGMSDPWGVVYDPVNDRLFVAEDAGNRVKVYNFADGVSNGENAVNVLGQAGFTTATAGNTQAGMNSPTGLAYDSANQRLFVAQITNNRVTVYDVASIANGENAIAVLGQSTYTATTAATTQAGLNVPYDVAYDSANQRLFVAQDTGSRVSVFDVASITNGENATAVLGQSDYTTATAATTQAGLNDTRYIEYDSANQRLFVVQDAANRVSVFDVASITNGENAVAVLGQSTYTAATAATTQAGMNSPTGVAFDSTNNRLYVTQASNFRVSVFDVASITNGENAVDLLGQYDDDPVDPGPVYTKSTANNAPNTWGLNAPQDIAVDRVHHRLFMTDTTNNRVLVYNLDNSNMLEDRIPDFVLGQPDFYTNAASVPGDGMSTPQAVDYDPVNDRLFVATSGHHRVLVFDTATIVSGEDAAHIIGQPDANTVSAGNTQAKLNTPQGLEYDPENQYLYVSQSGNHRVSIFDLSDGITPGENAIDLLGQYDDSISDPGPVYTKSTANDGPNRLGYGGPAGSFVDPVDHWFFQADEANNRVLVYALNSDNTFPDRIPDYVLGQPNFYTTTAANTQAGMNDPWDVFYDPVHDRLFVAEDAGNRVKVYDFSDGVSNGENAVKVLGQAGFTTATAGNTQAGMNSPTGLAYSSASQWLFVAQITSNRVTVYDVSSISNGQNAIAVLGQSSFTTTTAATTQAGMNVPYDVAFDPVNNRLFVAQDTGNRVTVYDVAAISNGENAVAVLGQADYTTATAATTQAGLNDPRYVDYDVNGKRLFVAQDASNRVSVFDLSSGISNGMNASYVLGQSAFTTTTAATSVSGFNGPTGISFGSGMNALFVSEVTNMRTLKFDVASITNGENAVDVLGQYDDDLNNPGPVFTKDAVNNGPNRLGMNGPQDVILDSVNHRLYVADSVNNRVLAYNLDDSNVLEDRIPDHILGQANFHTNAAANTDAGMNAPQDFAFDPLASRLFVALSGQHRVLIFDARDISDGESAMNVIGQANFTTVSAGTTQQKLNAPQGLSFDPTSGRLHVVQSGNHRMTIFDASMRTLTGKLYEDEGLTPAPAGKKIAISLNGGPAAATGKTLAGGQFIIAGTGAGLRMTGGTLLSVYIDNETEKGVTISFASGSSMSGVMVYRNRLTVRSDSGSAVMTNVKLNIAHNADSDVTSVFTVDSQALNVKQGNGLVIWSEDTFTPGANVSVGSGITVRGTFNGGSNNVSLSGAWLVSAGGLFTAGTSTVNLNGLHQTVSGSSTFYNLRKVSNVAATLSFAGGTTQTVTGSFRFEGATGQALTLRSAQPGIRWLLDPQGLRNISNVYVTDSQNIHATAIECLSSCEDGGNNVNWNFSVSAGSPDNYFFIIGE